MEESKKYPVLVYSALIRLLRMVYAKLNHEEWPDFSQFVNCLISGETNVAHFALPYSTELDRDCGASSLERRRRLEQKKYALSQSFDISRDALTTIYVDRECFERLEKSCAFGHQVLGMPIESKDGSYKMAPVVAGHIIGSLLRWSGNIRETVYDCFINRDFAYCKAGYVDDEVIILYPYSIHDDGKAEFRQISGTDYFTAMVNSFESYTF